MRAIQKSFGKETCLEYNPPQYIPPSRAITDPKIISNIIWDSTSYSLPPSITVRQLVAYGCAPGGNSPGTVRQRKFIRQAVLGPPDSTSDFARVMGSITSEAIRMHVQKLHIVSQLNVVEIGALSWTHFVARLLYIPVKGDLSFKTAFDETELYERMLTIFRYIYMDEAPAKSSRLRSAALQANKDLAGNITEVCKTLQCPSFAHILFHRRQKTGREDSMPNHGNELLQRLFEGGKSVEEVTSIVVHLAVEIVAAGSCSVSLCRRADDLYIAKCRQLPRIIDTFLSEPHFSAHWPEIQKLSADTASWTTEALRTYVIEALRLSAPAAPICRVSDILPSISDWRYAQAVKKGDVLRLDIAAASLDPTRFPEPDQIKLNRPRESYLPFIDGSHGQVFREIVVAGLVAQLRVFGKLKGLRKAQGIQGMMKRKTNNGFVSFLSEAQDEWLPFPASKCMSILYLILRC
jgi:hypothetical protein